MTGAPRGYPYPIVYGPDFPDFKMLMRGGEQVFESRANQNLFLETDEDWGEFDAAGTFTMATMLAMISTWEERAEMLLDLIEMDVETLDWIDFHDEPRWEACPACTDLLNYCGSAASRSFLLSWWRAQYAQGLGQAWGQWTDWVRRVAESRGGSTLDFIAQCGARSRSCVRSRTSCSPSLRSCPRCGSTPSDPIAPSRTRNTSARIRSASTS